MVPHGGFGQSGDPAAGRYRQRRFFGCRQRWEGALALDPGGDGDAAANPFAKYRAGAFARFGDDAYGYTFGYHAEDYTPVGGGAFAGEQPAVTTAPNLEAGGSAIALGGALYNGNTGWMRTRLAEADAGRGGHLMRYGYDQLHRIRAGVGWIGGKPSGVEVGYRYDANGNLQRLRRLADGVAIDDLTYVYGDDSRYNDIDASIVGPNHATRIVDVAADVAGLGDVPRGEQDFQYNGVGNTTIRNQNGVRQQFSFFNHYGTIRNVSQRTSFLRYGYAAAGHRIWRRVSDLTSAPEAEDELSFATLYVRGAGGELLALYERDEERLMRQREVSLYGAERLGLWRYGSEERVVRNAGRPVARASVPAALERGRTEYALSNHLGNTLATVSDYKLVTGSSSSPGLRAHVLSASDYYPFGLRIPDAARGTGSVAEAYRYGFNGKEDDRAIGLGGQWSRTTGSGSTGRRSGGSWIPTH